MKENLLENKYHFGLFVASVLCVVISLIPIWLWIVILGAALSLVVTTLSIIEYIKTKSKVVFASTLIALVGLINSGVFLIYILWL